MKDIVVGISTCSRSPSYIHQTLATMLAATGARAMLPVTLVVDGKDDAYLRDYKHLGGIVDILPQTDDEALRRAGKPPHFGCAYNFYRALKHLPSASKGIVLFEDDVMFRTDWPKLLNNTVDEMSGLSNGNYILSLNSRSRSFADVPTFRRGKWFTSYGGVFYGTQGIFIPTPFRSKLLDMFEPYLKTFDTSRWMPVDEWLRGIGKDLWDHRDLAGNGVEGIFATPADLVEHIGLQSTGLGGRDYYSSKTFHWTVDDILARTDAAKAPGNGAWQGDQGYVADKSLEAALSAMCAALDIGSVLDVGCGPGYYVKALRESGIKAEGVDGNPLVRTLGEGFIQHDLSTPLKAMDYDMVMSLEVGEHVPASCESIFLDNITKHNPKYIVMSWAQPGQGGDGHVNCKPFAYIADALKSRGYTDMGILGGALRAGATLWWHKRNIMVMKRDETA